jgi:hypothetical protein
MHGKLSTITNTGKEPTDLAVTLFAPNQPRSPASITALAPGLQVVRRFAFPDRLAELRDQRAVIMVSEPQGKGRLTTSIVIK